MNLMKIRQTEKYVKQKLNPRVNYNNKVHNLHSQLHSFYLEQHKIT